MTRLRAMTLKEWCDSRNGHCPMCYFWQLNKGASKHRCIATDNDMHKPYKTPYGKCIMKEVK